MQQNLSVSITCPSCNKPAEYYLPDILGLASEGDVVAGFTSLLHAIMPGGDFVAAFFRENGHFVRTLPYSLI